MAKTPEQKEKEKRKETEESAKKQEEEPREKQEKKERLENIVRLGETNIDATKPVWVAIRRIPGVGFMFSNAVARVSGFGSKKIGELSEEEIKKLEDIIFNPQKYNIPSWLYNRKSDPETGENKHLIASQLELRKKLDINLMRKLKTYRGVRHALGLPVRGQRTRGSFRKGRTVGVSREKQKPGSKEKK